MAERDYEADHAAFQKRLAVIHKGETARALRPLIQALDKECRAACIAHWKEFGEYASTGYGNVPRAPYQARRSPASCAESIAEKLIDHMVWAAIHKCQP